MDLCGREEDARNRISEEAWYERHIQAAILRAERLRGNTRNASAMKITANATARRHDRLLDASMPISNRPIYMQPPCILEQTAAAPFLLPVAAMAGKARAACAPERGGSREDYRKSVPICD